MCVCKCTCKSFYLSLSFSLSLSPPLSFPTFEHFNLQYSPTHEQQTDPPHYNPTVSSYHPPPPTCLFSRQFPPTLRFLSSVSLEGGDCALPGGTAVGAESIF